ncbi:MAG: hypothetical protein MR555_01220 [Spirochaetia bacterium]|nr:hypothetical protein [Spirochaetia bacterium]
MKKILSVFTAVALLFGFASCNGDMHEVDSEKQKDAFGLAIVGITNDPGNHVIPMNLDTPDGSEQSLKITFTDGFEFTGKNGITYKLLDDSTGSWRGSDPMTASHFKVVPLTSVKADATPDWNAGHYGSLNGENVQYIKAGEDYQKIGKLGEAGVSGDPKHLVFDSVTAGGTYVLRAKYDSAKGVVQLKLDGIPNNPAEMRLNIVGESTNFPAKDKDGKDIMYSMTQAGMQYTYDFIATADEDVEFYITNSLAGTFGGDLETGALELNAATTQNLKFSVKKNVEYKLTLDISAGINKATIKREIVDMLKNASINGNWRYADKFYEVDAKDKSYIFKADNENLNLIINRITGVEGDDKLYWGVNANTTISVDGDAIDLIYNKDAKTPPESIPVKGIEKGCYYQISLEVDNAEFSLSVKIEKLKPVVFPDNMGLMIWFNTSSDWSNSKYLKLTKDKEYTYSCDVETSGEVNDVRFDFVTGDTKPDWNDRWGVQSTGGTITLGERHGPFINKEPANRDKFAASAGKTYHFEIDTSAGVWVTITEKE